jgi:hypothetical protein
MAALHEPLAFYAGDSWEIEVACHYADGAPFNLGAGAAVEWSLSDAKGNVVVSMSLGAGIAVLDGAATPPHRCLITLSPEQSAALAAGEYRDRTVATDPAGLVSTQAVGAIRVKK